MPGFPSEHTASVDQSLLRWRVRRSDCVARSAVGIAASAVVADGMTAGATLNMRAGRPRALRTSPRDLWRNAREQERSRHGPRTLKKRGGGDGGRRFAGHGCMRSRCCPHALWPVGRMIRADAGAILVVVAFHMREWRTFVYGVRAPRATCGDVTRSCSRARGSDRCDEVGMVLAASGS